MKRVALRVIAADLGRADTRNSARHHAHRLPSYVADRIREKLPALGIVFDNVEPIRGKAKNQPTGAAEFHELAPSLRGNFALH
ncbi:MAG: hypothetical protein HY749_00450 [Gammaproteobacteria bacterium]|nr:hypothetical protein [Gammaproteobacteria bacterium]